METITINGEPAGAADSVFFADMTKEEIPAQIKESSWYKENSDFKLPETVVWLWYEQGVLVAVDPSFQELKILYVAVLADDVRVTVSTDDIVPVFRAAEWRKI